MKKLFLSILVICSLLGGNAYAGFFKSSLEKCADAEMSIDEISPSQEWKKIEKSDLRKITDKAEAKRIKKTSSQNDFSKSYKIMDLERSYRMVKVRDIPLSERKRVAKKFFNKNLKEKLKYQKYETSFEFCTYDKKRNLELFDAKYD